MNYATPVSADLTGGNFALFRAATGLAALLSRPGRPLTAEVGKDDEGFLYATVTDHTSFPTGEGYLIHPSATGDEWFLTSTPGLRRVASGRSPTALLAALT